MAKRMKSKIQPSVQTLVFTGKAINPDEDKTFWIDISQCVSLVNRRFYRQGLNWAVGSVKIRTRTAGLPVHCEMQIQKLPNTWVLSNSWEKGFRAWNKMIKNALDDTDQQSLKGKFLDYKIYANDQHHTDGYAENLLPIDCLGQEALPGEWIPSKYEVPVTRNVTALPYDTGETAEYEIIAIGGNYPGTGASGLDAISLVNGYANSRALPNTIDPNTPADSIDADGVTPENWLAALFNEGISQDSGVIDDVQEYDQPPYPYEGDGFNSDTMYPGGQNQLSGMQIHDESSLTNTSIGGVVNFKGGNFPCGLMGIRFNNFLVFTPEGPVQQNIEWDIQLDLIPGTHRGYLAESMTEM